ELDGSGDRTEAMQRLIVSLAALGIRDGAQQLLDDWTALLGFEQPERLEAFLARRAQQAGGDLLAGRYEVIRLLGSGGMGRVYLARDRASGEEVAVKVVAAPSDPRAREGYRRFLREARAVSLLDHPHLVSVREVREDE